MEMTVTSSMPNGTASNFGYQLVTILYRKCNFEITATVFEVVSVLDISYMASY